MYHRGEGLETTNQPHCTTGINLWDVFKMTALILLLFIELIHLSGTALGRQAPVPLSIFRSNSKFDESSERSSFEYTRPITRDFAHVTTVTLSWRVQNIVVIRRGYFTLECFEFSANFEFDRNMLSGTGARSTLLMINSLWPGGTIQWHRSCWFR